MNMASVMMGWGAGVEEKGWRKGPWTPEEDKMLSEHVNLHGEGRWSSVARCTGLNRSGKSCRLRWVNYLRPGLKRGHLTPQEEGIIIELHALLGNKWSTIARYLPGRTDNEIKNYWRTHFKKKDKCTEKQQKRKAQILIEKQQQQQQQQAEAAESDRETKKMKSDYTSIVPQKQDEAVGACSELQNVIGDELQPAQATQAMNIPLTCPSLDEIQCVPAALVSMSQLCGTTSTVESSIWSPDNNTIMNTGSENDHGLWSQLWNLEDDHHTGYNKCSNSVAVQLSQAITAPFSGAMYSEATRSANNSITWGENIHPGNYFYGGSGYIF